MAERAVLYAREYPLAREGRLMPRRLSTTSGVRQRLIDTMQASRAACDTSPLTGR
ncbi:hypothetical protein [Mycobacterium malmoense]|uniref:hypothetical protein n=1 Tax=Mycobacterium malmoense TaxID=1780 RepID=UPI00159EF474|nr:hypothetical protein [Mycobacterium malmoense]